MRLRICSLLLCVLMLLTACAKEEPLPDGYGRFMSPEYGIKVLYPNKYGLYLNNHSFVASKNEDASEVWFVSCYDHDHEQHTVGDFHELQTAEEYTNNLLAMKLYVDFHDALHAVIVDDSDGRYGVDSDSQVHWDYALKIRNTDSGEIEYWYVHGYLIVDKHTCVIIGVIDKNGNGDNEELEGILQEMYNSYVPGWDEIKEYEMEEPIDETVQDLINQLPVVDAGTESDGVHGPYAVSPVQ